MRTALYRKCPACSERSVPVRELVLSRARCENCKTLVRAHPLGSALFYVTAFLATLVLIPVVVSQLGYLWAVLWFTVPIGALAYLKARFSPLESAKDEWGSSDGSGN